MGKNAKRKRRESLQAFVAEERSERLANPPEKLLPATFLQAIHRLGLEIDTFPPYPSDQDSACHFGIFLPESSGGNQVPSPAFSYCRSRNGDHQATRMPNMGLTGESGKWTIAVHQFAPGPGPGDFCETFDAIETALDRIQSYYFNPDDLRFLEYLDHVHQTM